MRALGLVFYILALVLFSLLAVFIPPLRKSSKRAWENLVPMEP